MYKSYKVMVITILTTAMLLSGCSAAAAPDTVEPSEAQESPDTAELSEAQESPETLVTPGSSEASESQASESENGDARVYAKGPYGRISVALPGDWVYQPYSVNSGHSNSGSYGMWIRPAKEKSGYIDLNYMQMFGVCGTGLEQETVTLAGDEAWIGTYDNHKMWDFINFRGVNEGVTAQNVMGEEWLEEDRETALAILDTLNYEPDQAEGAVSYFKRDSEIPEVGLIAEAHDITSSGAVVRFRVWDPELASGDLEYGQDYSLERLEGDEWTEMPVVFKGEWAVTSEALIIPKDPESPGRDWAVNWEWLYGKLEPGDYRIGKTIMDFRGTGDYDTYTIYVYFRYAGEADADNIGTIDREIWLSPAGAPADAETTQEPAGTESEIKAILPKEEAENKYAELSAEEFLFGDQHYEWWSENREAVNRSAGLRSGMDTYNRNVLQELLITDSSENTVCSPLNLYLALSMLAETADGNTRQQILDVLQVENIEALRERAAALWSANSVNTPILTSQLANSLWLRNDIGYHEDTLQTLAGDYHAASYRGKMGSPEMNEELRRWTDENTGGLLTEYADAMELRPETILALVSTLYYKASWTEQFSEALTDKGVFHGTDGDVETDMMHQSSGMSIYERDKFSAIGLNLSDSGEMYFFLPKEGISPEEVIKDPALINVLHRGEGLYTGYAIINMTIPKFSVRQKTDLMDHLNRLGIKDASVAGLADFSPLTEEASNVFLSAAEHAVMVEIDEEGVTGAVYTELMLDGAAAVEPEPVDFVLDRPFCFVIAAPDGSILFAGIIQNV